MIHWKSLPFDQWWESIHMHQNYWGQRAELAVSLLAGIQLGSVHDFGCGEMLLKSFIPQSVPYYGYDVNDSQGAIVLDLDEELPDLHPPPNSVAVFLGVLETRGEQLDRILLWAAEHFSWILTSYTDRRLDERPDWSTLLTQNEMRSKLGDLGLVEEDRYLHHVVYAVRVTESEVSLDGDDAKVVSGG